MENVEIKKHNLVAAWILTSFAIAATLLSLLFYSGAKDVLSSNNAVEVLFGGILMLVIFYFFATIALALSIYPIIRSSKLLFGKNDKRVPVWFIFILSLAVIIGLVIMTLTLYL